MGVIEIIEEIPGPVFLGFFLCIMLICLILIWLLPRLFDTSLQYPLPGFNQFDPITIAALRGACWTKGTPKTKTGSVNTVIKTVVFNFWYKSLVDIQGEGMNAWLASIKSREKPSGPIENEVYQFLLTPRKYVDLLRNSYFRSQIKNHLESDVLVPENPEYICAYGAALITE